MLVNVPEDALVLRPRHPPEPIADVGSAVRDALRFPLSGSPLEALVTAPGRATIVVEPPELPLPGAAGDPRRAALAATIDELERLGVPSQQQTILVAGGLNRRAGHRELEALLLPSSRAGSTAASRCTTPRPEISSHLGTPDGRRCGSTGLVETDLVVSVTAAETVLHGGPGALVGACGAETLRAATAHSLLETAAARGWQLGLALERALATRVPVIGASLVLNPPRLPGRFRDYPYEDASSSTSRPRPLRRLSLLPAGRAARSSSDLGRELTAVAAFAGPPRSRTRRLCSAGSPAARPGWTRRSTRS